MSVLLSDTMDSHRLVLWAQELIPGKGEELAHAIGRRYFEQATPLADREMLVDAAAECGLNRVAAEAYLKSDSGFDAVRRSVAEAHRAGIHSIPVFLFTSGGFAEAVHGSADVERFSSVLRSIKRHWKDRTPTAGVDDSIESTASVEAGAAPKEACS